MCVCACKRLSDDFVSVSLSLSLCVCLCTLAVFGAAIGLKVLQGGEGTREHSKHTYTLTREMDEDTFPVYTHMRSAKPLN